MIDVGSEKTMRGRKVASVRRVYIVAVCVVELFEVLFE